MDNAACAVREGGVVILLAECEEGSGSKVLEETFKRLKTPCAIKAELEKDFRIGANKAFAVTRPISKARFILVTALDKTLAKDMLFTAAVDTVEEALALAKQYVGETPSIILMPEGSLTVPARCEIIRHIPGRACPVCPGIVSNTGKKPMAH